MKKFTFVVAAMALCVNVGFAQTFRSMNGSNDFETISMKRVDNSNVKKIGLNRSAREFGFSKMNQGNIAKKPAQTAILETPVALSATNVSDYYFVANWELVSGADGYIVEAYRNYETTVDTTYCALYEDFYYVTESDEYLTTEGYLYNCYRYDWYLVNAKQGDKSIIFPKTTDAGTSLLETPFLDLAIEGEESGSLKLSIVAEGAVDDLLGIGCYYYESENAQKPVESYLGELKFDATTLRVLINLEDIPYREGVVFYFVTMNEFENSSDITIREIMLDQPVKAGTKFDKYYGFKSILGEYTSCPVFTMERNTGIEGVSDNFYYGVYAVSVNMATGEITDQSEMSNEIIVGESSAVEGIQASNDKIFVHDNLHVVLEKPATIAVYNMAGVLVMSVEGVEGENEIALPAAGAYIVKAGNTVAKVMK